MDRVMKAVLLAALVSWSSLASAETRAAVNPYEARAARAFEAAKKDGPLALRAFLVGMPKGADLHVHLSGAVYAESWLRAAAEDDLCIDPKDLKFVKHEGEPCRSDHVAAAKLLGDMRSPKNQDLYDRLVDAFSMRSYVPAQAWSGHDQFFSTFDHFGGTGKKHTGEWVDEVVTRAAAQNEQYVELMETPPFSHAAELGFKTGWNDDLAGLRKKLLDAGLDEEVATAREHIESALETRKKLEHCDTTEALPGCRVEVRFIYQILRGHPRQQVFAQTLLGFEAISKIPQFVGINFVMPEDGYLSMTDYTAQMKMLEYLHSVYPAVHISLHAGELAPGLVPPEGLRFHIRQAVELGHAERIGHGVDVMYEDDAPGLLKELAAKHVMVEINLTSNDGILGIKGIDSPLPFYRRAHVPVALSTDDEGVSRIDLTHEYVRAAMEFGLTYAELKQMARTGMEHDFLPGRSLWAEPDGFGRAVGECRDGLLGAEKPAPACRTFLEGSEKATAQWEQERRFGVFEGKF